MKYLCLLSALLYVITGRPQNPGQPPPGCYNNPVIHADYSDPDAIRVGNDYYMTASSFNFVPGLPILHSRDLVNWRLIGYALQKLVPENHYSTVQHGGGVWAPAIRFHNNQFYIYYPDPDFGIYLVTARKITGPWSQPVLVQEGKGLIDPCPFWDDNGKAWLVHAYAGSRAGIKSMLVIKELNKEGTKITGNAVMVYDGHKQDPTVEGPKLYKRNGYYYIFAPAGGVATGWQTVLRSKNIYGPYERRVVLHQGATNINGPHQGAWVTTPAGQDWFLHFQDKDGYGRIVHLQPMHWKNDWPVIGDDMDGDGIGEPVSQYKMPVNEKSSCGFTLQSSDEFNTPVPGLQWQWRANPKEGWAFGTAGGKLRMYSVYQPDTVNSMWSTPNILSQKLPAETFTATVKVAFNPLHDGEKFGLVIMGHYYHYIALRKSGNNLEILSNFCINAADGGVEENSITRSIESGELYLSVEVSRGGYCKFFYSLNGTDYLPIGTHFTAAPGKWVGATLGLFCLRSNITNNAGFADIDWFRITK